MNLIISSDSFGQGNTELGRIVMEKFFMTLTQSPSLPEKIIFYNTGVTLCEEGSPVETYLEALSEMGVDLVACSTCTEYLNVALLRFVRAGTMTEVVETLTGGTPVRTV